MRLFDAGGHSPCLKLKSLCLWGRGFGIHDISEQNNGFEWARMFPEKGWVTEVFFFFFLNERK